MKASELIEKLEELVQQHGDLPVWDSGDDWGFMEVTDVDLGTCFGRHTEPYFMIEESR